MLLSKTHCAELLKKGSRAMPAWIRKNDKAKKIADTLMRGKPVEQRPAIKQPVAPGGLPNRSYGTPITL